jgi:hypothetical protein
MRVDDLLVAEYVDENLFGGRMEAFDPGRLRAWHESDAVTGERADGVGSRVRRCAVRKPVAGRRRHDVRVVLRPRECEDATQDGDGGDDDRDRDEMRTQEGHGSSSAAARSSARVKLFAFARKP